ncbi:Rossmann fold domain-containing protein [Sphingomonas immobilis]|uniref:Short chain dehydrogenase-like proteobacteria domain-containing protein n=1 Tax=Sphingomonas immobilis TaxID=3063997 RepID=A0ABT8ZZC6_9SPHN|nr:hypothetical protein [Sphingomonas sp. CA1-15]MDO7842933.1 hypothetical protein [Sphingomonas sp. CA1-15]
MREALDRALAGVATIAGPDDAVEAVIARLRNAPDPAVLVILPEVSPLARAMLRAAIAPLAAERAPATRIGAVEIAGGSDPSDVIAAVQFLANAASTTGQVLAVAPPAPSPYAGGRPQDPSDSSTKR